MKISLLRFLILTSIAGILFSLVGKLYFLSLSQNINIKEIESLGGFVETSTMLGSPEVIRFDVDLRSGNHNSIQDSDGKLLANFRDLRGIVLCYTSVGDEMLRHLEELESLDFIYLQSTKVTKNGICKLQSRFPDCEIFWDGNPAPRLGLRRAEAVQLYKANQLLNNNRGGRQ